VKSKTGRSVYLVCFIILVILVLSLTFKSDIEKLYCRFKFESPVEIENVRITFPKGMGYNADEESIVLFDINSPDTYLYVGITDLSKETKENLHKFLSKKELQVLSVKDTAFKGQSSVSLSYLDTSWRYNKSIYVIPKNVRITYTGTRDNYKLFKDIIDSIDFVEEDEQ